MSAIASRRHGPKNAPTKSLKSANWVCLRHPAVDPTMLGTYGRPNPGHMCNPTPATHTPDICSVQCVCWRLQIVSNVYAGDCRLYAGHRPSGAIAGNCLEALALDQDIGLPMCLMAFRFLVFIEDIPEIYINQMRERIVVPPMVVMWMPEVPI